MPVTPQYPFGHGLSYTTFELSDLKLEQTASHRTATLTVKVTVKNTGARAGDEVVQVYVSDVAASVTRPVKQLRAFERVTSQPGESKTLVVHAGAAGPRALDAKMKWVVEPGEFRVTAGTSSEGGLTASFTLR